MNTILTVLGIVFQITGVVIGILIVKKIIFKKNEWPQGPEAVYTGILTNNAPTDAKTGKSIETTTATDYKWVVFGGILIIFGLLVQIIAIFE